QRHDLRPSLNPAGRSERQARGQPHLMKAHPPVPRLILSSRRTPKRAAPRLMKDCRFPVDGDPARPGLSRERRSAILTDADEGSEVSGGRHERREPTSDPKLRLAEAAVF